jgi:large subunit ribosomal protein L6
MATSKDVQEIVTLPEGISASYEGGVLTVKGPKGEVTRVLRNPKLKITTSSESVTFDMATYSKNEKKVLHTFRAHIRNMFKGVTEGHEYKLKICSGHFPMNVSMKGNQLEVKNFIGEAVPRRLTFKEGADVKVNGDEIVITGIDKEIVAQSAASIETLTRRSGFDRRIFQDGIYITEKDGKKIA